MVDSYNVTMRLHTTHGRRLSMRILSRKENILQYRLTKTSTDGNITQLEYFLHLCSDLLDKHIVFHSDCSLSAIIDRNF